MLALLVGALIAVGVAVVLDHFVPRRPPLGATYPDASLPIESRVENLLSYMTLEEKIGQMTLVEKGSISPYDSERYMVGAILSGSGAHPENNTPEGWRTMIGAYQKSAARTRLSIPLFYGADAGHGQGNIPGATVFPHNLGLAAAHDAQLIERIAAATALESRAVGINWLFAPTLDLPRDIRWGRVYETFGDNPQVAAALGAAYVRGTTPHGVLSTAKHFVGMGSMTWGSSTSDTPTYRIDQGKAPADEAALREEYLPPFRAAVDAGALSVMAGLSTWGEEKIAASSYLLTDVLKGELGFNGFVVSDWYGVYEVATSTYDSMVMSVNAGVDMVMLPYDYDIFAREMKRAVERGDISKERVDDAVRRILRAKFSIGLFDKPILPSLSVLGASEHRALAREAVQKSLVLLKNDTVLPISPSTQKIRVAGSAADNTGRQSGGWTLEWQGVEGNVVPGATSILESIKSRAGNTSVEYEANGIFVNKNVADVGIAIVGEKPYAEGWGDTPSPQLSEEDTIAIANLKKSVRTLVVIVIAGRPLIITNELPEWDAAVMAWLPGAEGRGVADALFGDVPFTATLPMLWPASLTQLPVVRGTTANRTLPLFARGFSFPK